MFGNGKYIKAITFSYDDGVTQDIRLIRLLNKYGMKCTFNLNSGYLGDPGMLVRNGVDVRHDKIAPELVRELYRNHEIAVHTLHHPFLPELSDEEIIRETEEDRLALSELAGYDVVGMAYPCGSVDERVINLLNEKTGILYARTTVSTFSFKEQKGTKELLGFNPTLSHRQFDDMMRLGREFVALEPEEDSLLYIWGHSYELDAFDYWDEFEGFLKSIAFRDDIFYGTNKEVLLKN